MDFFLLLSASPLSGHQIKQATRLSALPLVGSATIATMAGRGSARSGDWVRESRVSVLFWRHFRESQNSAGIGLCNQHPKTRHKNTCFVWRCLSANHFRRE